MDFSTICRTCLSEENLNPIFLISEDQLRYSNAVFVISGVKIDPNDGLPQNMCTACIEFLNESIKFRRKCINVESQLLELKTLMHNETNKTSLEHIMIEKNNSLNSELKEELLTSELTSDKTEVKDEFIEYEILEDDDDDDKPLKFLVDTDQCNGDKSLVPIDDMSADNEMNEVENKKPDPPYYPGLSNTKTRRVTCKLCQKDLSIRSVDAHMARSHPGADERKQKCELCDTYVTQEKMGRHMRMVHGSERTLRCGYCKTEFDNKEILVQHVATCTAKKKKRKVCESGREMTECDICHKIMQKASLRMHKDVKHAGLGPVCEHCGRRFGNKFRLNEHYRAKHGYEKFKCSYCDFESAAIMAMRNHERKHRGEKPFACDTCDAKFHAAYLLAQHKQSHRTEKLVKCDLCPASFKANNSLHMHKLSCHSRVMYECAVCNRAYSCRHYAVKHARQVHRHTGPQPPLLRVEMNAES